MTGHARALRQVTFRHPRHLLLAMLVAGLLAGPRSAAALLCAAICGLALAGRRLLAPAALTALLAGAAIADARLAALDRTALEPLLGSEIEATVTLLEHPRLRRFGVRAAATRLESGPGRGERVLLRAAPRVRWPAGSTPGVELRVRGRLAALGPFDAHERLRNAHALLRAGSLAAGGGRRGGIAGALDAIRGRAERALQTGIPPPLGALARGMVLGQDAALTADVRDDFRATGLAHLVAASGANVMLLATLALAAGAVAGLGLSARLLLALALVAAYVPLAGGGPSIQRAGVMGAAGLLAALAGRPASRWYALLLAAAVTLACNPRSVQDAGWQLSFAAVVALLALAPRLSARLRTAGMPHALAEVVAVTVAATAGTAPLIALHFERLSLVSLPANVLAAPAVAAVMWLGALAATLAQFAPALALPVTQLASLPLGYLTWLADRAASLPLADVSVPAPGPIATIAIYAGGAALVLAWRRARGQPSVRLAVVLAVLAIVPLAAVALLGRPRPEAPRELTVSFLDIGQGDATLIQHAGATVLVDTGPPAGPILERLREAGVRRIDVLVATHAALDHDGAAKRVLDAVPVGLLVDGEERSAAGRPRASLVSGGPFGAAPAVPVAQLAARHRVRRVASDAGQLVRAGPLELRVLWPHRVPAAAPGAEPNDRATVLHVRDGSFDLLLTADAESNVTAGLDLPVVDALKVAHHGSADAGLPALLARLRPRIAVISVGAHNIYGHPVPATIAALRAVPVVRRTDRDGTVRLTVRGDRMSVRSVR